MAQQELERQERARNLRLTSGNLEYRPSRADEDELTDRIRITEDATSRTTLLIMMDEIDRGLIAARNLKRAYLGSVPGDHLSELKDVEHHARRMRGALDRLRQRATRCFPSSPCCNIGSIG